MGPWDTLWLLQWSFLGLFKKKDPCSRLFPMLASGQVVPSTWTPFFFGTPVNTGGSSAVPKMGLNKGVQNQQWGAEKLKQKPKGFGQTGSPKKSSLKITVISQVSFRRQLKKP